MKQQAEAEGLDKIFKAAGFDWREPGCSMCLAKKSRRAQAGRALRLDFEPQFRGPPRLSRRTHLVSPAMATVAAIASKFVDVRD